MTKRTEIIVAGEPKAQPRAKASVICGRVVIFTPNTARAYKADIVRAVAQARAGGDAVRYEGPVCVRIDFFLRRPRRLMTHGSEAGVIACPKKPDIDNLAKAVLDALTMAEVWGDDAQVVELYLTKRYHGKEGAPWTSISIKGLE